MDGEHLAYSDCHVDRRNEAGDCPIGATDMQ